MVINFLLMALVIFCFIKIVNSLTARAEQLMKKQAEEAPAPAPTTKKCPYCLSEIPLEATRCAFCTSEQPETIKTE